MTKAGRDLMKENSVIIHYLNQIQAQIYIMVTRSVKSGINLTNSQSIAPNSDTCTSTVTDYSLPQLHYATCSLPPILPILQVVY